MALKKVTITRVYKNDTNKDGVPYTYKKGKNEGKAFARIGIQTNESGETTYYNNAMTTDKAYNVKEGDEAILRLEQTAATDGSGKMFDNWSFATQKEIEVFNQFNPQ